MSDIVLLALTAAFNPTLLTATTLMLILPNPKRLMLGYWFGAMLTGITAGIVIVFVLEGSSAANATKNNVSPAIDLALALIFLTVAFVLASGRDEPVRERRAERRETKKPPRWQQQLGRGTARTTFVIGVVLSFPGASYLTALTRLNKLDYSTAGTVVVIIGFNLVQLVLLEGPLLAFAIAPEKTPMAIERAKAWAGKHGRRYGAIGLAVVGTALLVRAVIELT